MTNAPPAEPTTPPPLVLFDGVCGLCDRTVQLLLRLDRHQRLRFAPLQGPTAAAVFACHAMATDLVSIVFVPQWPPPGVAGPGPRLGEGGADPAGPAAAPRLRSAAVLGILAAIGGGWGVVAGLGRLLPRRLGDALYDAIAARRYRWFGRRDSCRLPTAAERSRFLD